MTTHVFVVDETTFKVHLNYLFVGTGSGDKDVDFINSSGTSSLYPSIKHAAEASLVLMMADCSRVRKGDFIIFYLQATSNQEGKFYGAFQADSDAFLDRNNGSQYLASPLGKNLPFRILIKPYEVYSDGVTEWEALDEIRSLTSPCQMLWSLIYRKLKGNRGNTMITIYEAERLFDLIRRKNHHVKLPNVSAYDYNSGTISVSSAAYPYTGNTTNSFNILPRLISKYNSGLAHEAHLQMYITQNVGKGTNVSLDNKLGINGCQIEWIGNEVSCGVGMQRIDVMISQVVSETQRILMPIELKAIPASIDNLRQINRYIDWIEQYYIPNRISSIQPVLICRPGGFTPAFITAVNSFNAKSAGRYLPLNYIEYDIVGSTIVFK